MPPASQQQLSDFLEACALGRTEDDALLLAQIPLSEHHLVDAALSHPDCSLIPPTFRTNWRDYVRSERIRPISEVQKRAHRLMLDANNPDNPMPPDLTLRILATRDPETWSPKQSIQIETKPLIVLPEAATHHLAPTTPTLDASPETIFP